MANFDIKGFSVIDSCKIKAMFLLFCFCIIFVCFLSNFMNIANDEFFDKHQKEMEGFVLSRIVLTEDKGIGSEGGLLIQGVNKDVLTFDDIVDDQYYHFLQNRVFNYYWVYESHHGGNAAMFYLINTLLPFSAIDRYLWLGFINTGLVSLVFCLIVLWFYSEFGIFVAFSVLLSIILSQWLTVFGRNLYWAIWNFYLPALAVMYYFKYNNSKTFSLRRLSIIIFIMICVKCYISGYEYITTAILMMLVPIVFYVIKLSYNFKRIIIILSIAMLASFSAILLSVFLLTAQIAVAKGSLSQGIEHITLSLQRRTYADSNILPKEYKERLDVSVISVLKIYFSGIYLDATKYIDETSGILYNYLKIRYINLIKLFMLSTMILLLLSKFYSPEERRLIYALSASCWFSILAPLSWLIIFKSHSAMHYHMNYLVWQMPFTMFGFAVSGLSLLSLISIVMQRKRPLSKRFFY